MTGKLAHAGKFWAADNEIRPRPISKQPMMVFAKGSCVKQKQA